MNSPGWHLYGLDTYLRICVCTVCHGKHVAPEIARAACRLLKAIFCAMILYRRQIQLQSVGNLGARQALQMVLKRDGPKGLYKGFLPNALKNLPNKGNWGAACILAGVQGFCAVAVVGACAIVGVGSQLTVSAI